LLLLNTTLNSIQVKILESNIDSRKAKFIVKLYSKQLLLYDRLSDSLDSSINYKPHSHSVCLLELFSAPKPFLALITDMRKLLESINRAPNTQY
jgi:hypothetical protein